MYSRTHNRHTNFTFSPLVPNWWSTISQNKNYLSIGCTKSGRAQAFMGLIVIFRLHQQSKSFIYNDAHHGRESMLYIKIHQPLFLASFDFYKLYWPGHNSFAMMSVSNLK